MKPLAPVAFLTNLRAAFERRAKRLSGQKPVATVDTTRCLARFAGTWLALPFAIALTLPADANAAAYPRIYAESAAPVRELPQPTDWVWEHLLSERLRTLVARQTPPQFLPTRATLQDEPPGDWWLPLVRAVYRGRDFRPIFTRDGALTPAGRILLAQTKNAARHGIPSDELRPSSFEELLRSVERPLEDLHLRDDLSVDPDTRLRAENHLAQTLASRPFLLDTPKVLHDELATVLAKPPVASTTDEHDRTTPSDEALRADADLLYAHTRDLEFALLELLWRYAAALKLGNDYYAPSDPAMDTAHAYLATRGYGEASDGTTTAAPPIPQRPADVIRTPDEWRVDEFDQLLAAAEGQRHFAEALEKLVPTHGDYRALQEAWDRYDAIAREGGWAALNEREFPHAMQDSGNFRPLYERLSREGYLPASSSAQEVPYSPALQRALVQWKLEHQLPADDALDTPTLWALNTPVQDRLAQLELALQKIRSARYAHDSENEHIRVNIPAFEAQLWDQGDIQARWKVIVGKVRGNGLNQTPEMSALMTEIELNPYWYPPRRLLRAELTQGFMPPGPRNPMGRAKFLFPNKEAIYMHDTNQRPYFGTPFRAYSSGCIRVDEAEALAALLISRDRDEALATTQTWVQQKLERGARDRYYLRRPIPVHVEYRTAYIDASGRVRFGIDLYELDQEAMDAAIARVLARHPGLVEERPHERHVRTYRLARRIHPSTTAPADGAIPPG